MANFSFDIVSEVDLQEADNAVNQAKRNCPRGMTSGAVNHQLNTTGMKKDNLNCR